MRRIKQKIYFIGFIVCLFCPSIASMEGEKISLLPYFLATSGHKMSSGEYFESEQAGQEFFIYRDEEYISWKKFKYDADYIYHIEDSPWIMDLRKEIKCEDTGNPAFYRTYNQAGVKCENYESHENELGGVWSPLEMSAKESYSQTVSIVAFDQKDFDEEEIYRCCTSKYTGDIPYTITLTYQGAIQLPSRAIAKDGLILTIQLENEYKENFYFDNDKGWIGWDQGSAESGKYITGWEGDGELLEKNVVWRISNVPKYIPEMEGLTPRPADPAHLYVNISSNKDEFLAAKGALKKLPSIKPMTGPLPGPGWIPREPLPDIPENIPDDPENEIIKTALSASEATGIRASLILALLARESGYDPFTGTSNFCEALCSLLVGSNCSDCHDLCTKVGNQYCVYSNAIQCSNFKSIWDEVGERYSPDTKITIPLSSAGSYTAGGETLMHCGGAMGAAQAMPSSWNILKRDVKSITTNSPVSPWNLEDSFIFAGTHLANLYDANPECGASGGAKSKTCLGEVCSIHRYMGGHKKYAQEIVASANAIADAYGFEEGHCTAWTKLDTKWQLPVDQPTVLSSDASDHIIRGSSYAWDLTKTFGSEIYPIEDGSVSFASCDNAAGLGCWIKITHNNEYESIYAHLDKIEDDISIGDYVSKETIIGRVGCTGITWFGPNLHLEIIHNGVKIDPAQIFGNPASIELRYDRFCYSGGCAYNPRWINGCEPCSSGECTPWDSQENLCPPRFNPANYCW